MRRTTILVGSLLLSAVAIGCYASKFTVGSADQAKVDHAYVGDWSVKDGDTTTRIIVRNLDDKNLYVEMSDKPDKVARYTAFVGMVKDVQFANLRELSDDGSVPDERLIIR